MNSLVSLFTYNSYNGDKKNVSFICLDCGCNKAYRHKTMYGLTFLEGHFHCLKCKKEIDYASDDFIITDVKKIVQLTLF